MTGLSGALKLARFLPVASAEDIKAFDMEARAYNVDRLRAMFVLLLPVFVAHVVVFLFFVDEAPAASQSRLVGSWRSALIGAHGLMAVASALMVTHMLRARATQRVESLLYLTPLALSLGLGFGAALASIDQLVTTAVTPFVVACFGLAVLVRVRPKTMAFIYSGAFLLFAGGQAAFQADSTARLSNLVNGLGIAVISVGLSASLWASGLREFLQRQVIQRQNTELGTLAKKASAASKAKSMFLANMSHEIRTPMNGVLGLTEVLLGSNPTLKQRENLELIRRSGEALISLINDILDFSKIEAGQLRLEVRGFNLHDLLNDVVHMFEIAAQRKSLELKLDLAPRLPRLVEADPHRLRQVLNNLVGNALKFTESGSITVHVSSDDAKRLHFSVQDTGIGISPDAFARIFTAFQQADESTTRRFGGTGLGLSLCSELVMIMGGRLEVTSTLEVGSTFSFSIPLVEAAGLIHTPPRGFPRHRPELDAAPGMGLSVMVVDDNPVNLRVARGLLEKTGCAVVAVDTGEKALNLLRNESFDGVFMDVHMPGMDGLTATRILRTMEAPASKVFVSALTASALPEDVAGCRAAGMNDVIAKPVRVPDLVNMLHLMREHVGK
jgi:signal transduction histidine kinase/ActR/RegA family two-component response regulator